MKITIIRECSDFLKASEGKPLRKLLRNNGPDTRKVKVRKKKQVSEVGTIFNEVFSSPADIRQRCIFANGDSLSRVESYDSFFIFPINGFKYMFCPNVIDSDVEYTARLKELQETTPEDAVMLLKEVMQFEYVHNQNLLEAITRGDEIIIYGIPYYYAIRESTVKSYSTLFSL